MRPPNWSQTIGGSKNTPSTRAPLLTQSPSSSLLTCGGNVNNIKLKSISYTREVDYEISSKSSRSKQDNILSLDTRRRWRTLHYAYSYSLYWHLFVLKICRWTTICIVPTRKVAFSDGQSISRNEECLEAVPGKLAISAIGLRMK